MSTVEDKNCVQKQIDEILKMVSDLADSLETCGVQVKRRIAKLKNLEEKPWTWNPDKISWKKFEGPKGTYEKSVDVENSEFRLMLKDLEAHGGRVTREGWFYWLFDSAKAVGRKRRD